MNAMLHHSLRWAPRVLGIGVALFLSLFALDAFGQGKPFRESIPDFLIHLVPAAAVLVVVCVSWRREWIGAAACVGLAATYAWMTVDRPDWILVISGPLFVVGLLFLLSWLVTAPPHREA